MGRASISTLHGERLIEVRTEMREQLPGFQDYASYFDRELMEYSHDAPPIQSRTLSTLFFTLTKSAIACFYGLNPPNIVNLYQIHIVLKLGYSTTNDLRILNLGTVRGSPLGHPWNDEFFRPCFKIGKSYCRSAPVPGRSNHQTAKSPSIIGNYRLQVHRCGRGRPHSAF